MLTVKVCWEILPTPTTAGPVSKSVLKPPAVTCTELCAGQTPSGIHCTTLSPSHWNRPVIGFDDVTRMVRSAAVRSVIGLPNVTVTGYPTPTTAPWAGWTATTVGVAAAAKLAGVGRSTAIATTPTTT